MKDKDKKKLSKNQIRLIRFCVCLAAFIVLYAVGKTVGMPWYVGLATYLVVYFAIGYDVLYRAARNIVHGQVFDENFLMCVATVGAFAIGEYPEAAAVMLFYQLGELFQDYAVGKSRKSIASLMDIRPDKAVIFKDGQETEVAPEEVKIGDVIVVKAGEKIPVDGVVLNGSGSLDTSALTGESVPQTVSENSIVLSGAINLSSVLYIRAEKEFYDSTVAKILDMVENASAKKAKAENFITRFARYYTPAVVITAVVLAILPPLVIDMRSGAVWISWLNRALTFLVISCPCALVISVPMSFFGGIGCASRKGILFKGTSYLELIDKANIFVFDKTGTLTKGTFDVKKVIPAENRDEILRVACIAESGSLHPIAKSIYKAYGKSVDSSEYQITERSGRGMEATGPEGRILCGSGRLLVENGVAIIPVEEVGSVVYVAKDGQYLGAILIADTVRDDAKEVIKELKVQGAKTVMLTGDNEKYARAVAEEVGIDDFKYGLLPADKVVEMEAIMENKGKKDKVVYVGDGVNDAPVLMRADVGVSMGGVGSDSAVEASDMVLMHDNLTGLVSARKISKKTLKLAYENIVFILLVKAVVLILGALGIASMWLAVFADVGVAVLATLNSMRALTSKKS